MSAKVAWSDVPKLCEVVARGDELLAALRAHMRAELGNSAKRRFQTANGLMIAIGAYERAREQLP